jgi:uncharacterized BrkB/YihY/UPF0761 family membrane protein
MGVLVPLALLAVSVGIRVKSHADYWHPWELPWTFWLIITVISSMFVGVGAAMVWRCEPRKKPFDHDAVQLDADNNAD